MQQIAASLQRIGANGGFLFADQGIETVECLLGHVLFDIGLVLVDQIELRGQPGVLVVLLRQSDLVRGGFDDGAKAFGEFGFGFCTEEVSGRGFAASSECLWRLPATSP